ncbi:MAG TPA: hypothetical protein VK528_00520 [Flavobacterium sp.]|nr:hypothetical protein [Flavobacterium sp.]
MNRLRVKALALQLLGFGTLFLAIWYLVGTYTNVHGIWIQMIAFVSGTILAPKFQVVRTKDGEKMFMSWLFLKGIREIK